MTKKEMQQFWREAVKYLISDRVLYLRWKTREWAARILVSEQMSGKATQYGPGLSRYCWTEEKI